MNTTKITCPKCGTDIDVNSILSHQLEEEFKQKYNKEVTAEKQKFQEKIYAVEKQKAEFEEKQRLQDQQVVELVSAKLKKEKAQLELQLKAKFTDENADRISAMEKELQEKSEQVKELNKAKAEIGRIMREKNELKESLEADAEIKLNLQIAQERDKIRKQEKESNELKLRELQIQLDDQKKLTEEMARKQSQGSMQLQGEAQELGIEEWLAKEFPLDTINEIKKGERGADCIHTVHTRQRQNCGTIYYESKRTKEFGSSWIEKFKNDIREKGSYVGVLVTEVYPKGMQRMGMVDGIWICSFEEFKGLCFVLRESIIQLSSLASSQENKGEKMIMLYDFLTTNEFRLQVEAIVEGFSQMQMDLNAEKRSIQGHWKKREKQIQKVLLNTNHMYNSIKGIAGSAIQSIKMLELPESIDEIDE
jgi:hypothetical protein